MSDGLLWILSHRYANVGRPSRTYLQQLRTDTECTQEDLPEKMDDRDECTERERARERERERELCAWSTT